MAHKKSFNSARAGFTLIELLVAMTILAMVVAIVYASFMAVATTTEDARAAALELRSRSFLHRNLAVNFAQVTEGWLPGAQGRAVERAASSAVPAAVESYDVRYTFKGEDRQGPLGPADTFGFVSSAPLMGAQGLPGFPKWVTYEVISEEKEALDPLSFSDTGAEAMLQIVETPIMSADPNATALTPPAATGFGSPAEESSPFSEVSWSIPIETMNVQYFDGASGQWVDSWDSNQRGYLPWAVDIKINFPPPPNSEEARERDVFEEPDFRFLYALPAGAGVRDPTPAYEPPRDAYRDALLGGGT